MKQRNCELSNTGTHTYIYTYIHTHGHTHACTHACMYTQTCVHMHRHVWVCICMYLSTYMLADRPMKLWTLHPTPSTLNLWHRVGLCLFFLQRANSQPNNESWAWGLPQILHDPTNAFWKPFKIMVDPVKLSDPWSSYDRTLNRTKASKPLNPIPLQIPCSTLTGSLNPKTLKSTNWSPKSLSPKPHPKVLQGPASSQRTWRSHSAGIMCEGGVLTLLLKTSCF